MIARVRRVLADYRRIEPVRVGILRALGEACWIALVLTVMLGGIRWLVGDGA